MNGTLSALVCSLTVSIYLLVLYKKLKKENTELYATLQISWKMKKLLHRDFLLNVSPTKIRYLTKEEAAEFYDFHYSVVQDDSGPDAGLYIIEPTVEEIARINQFCKLVGCRITWPLSRAPYYVIPGEMTDEERHRYVLHH